MRTSNLPRENSEESIDDNEFELVDVQDEEAQGLQVHEGLIRNANAIIETLFHEEMFLLAEELIEGGLAPLVRAQLPGPRKGRRGVPTNIDAVEEYLNQVGAIMEESWEQYLARLQTPIPPEPLEMLSYLRVVEDEEAEPEFDKEEDNSNELILHQDLLEAMEGRTEVADSNLLGYAQLHNRAVFDALNEALDHERPYGLLGRPFPWKAKDKFDRRLRRGDYLSMVDSAKERVLVWCEANCGTFFDKENPVFGHIDLTEEQVRAVREHRLSRLMASELFEGEEKWTIYDDEETEILMDVCHQVIKAVFEEEAAALPRSP
jgi:hypothetical protein